MIEKALLLIDIQNDFLPGGSLPVPQGDQIIPLVNQYMPEFSHVIATQDWHPSNHSSFSGRSKEGIWPVHCVQNTWGAELAEGLFRERIQKIFFKGTDPQIDSYSAFFDNQRVHSTGLFAYLQKKQVQELHVAGIATDICVLYSVLDALALHFKVCVLCDACRAIEDAQGAFVKMEEQGARLLNLRSSL